MASPPQLHGPIRVLGGFLRFFRFPFPDPAHRERLPPARRKQTAKNAKTRKERQEFGQETNGLYQGVPATRLVYCWVSL
jgi:hypothetical protein